MAPVRLQTWPLFYTHVGIFSSDTGARGSTRQIANSTLPLTPSNGHTRLMADRVQSKEGFITKLDIHIPFETAVSQQDLKCISA